MKPSVYLETSIISYLAARPSRDPLIAAHQQVTRDWWTTAPNRYELFISEAVVEEVGGGDQDAASKRLALVAGIPSLLVTPENIRLGQRIAREASLPTKAGIDALHVAIAADHRIGLLLTWNCKHIASPTFRPRIESVCRAAGLTPPEITTPYEMLGM